MQKKDVVFTMVLGQVLREIGWRGRK